jgi:hypothetical protein
MILVRIVALIGAIILTASIVWATESAGQSLSEAIAWLTSNPWGVVSLIDLYLSFFIIAVLIWVFEPNKLIALVFILPLPFIGGLWPAIWLVWRIGAVVAARNGGTAESS